MTDQPNVFFAPPWTIRVLIVALVVVGFLARERNRRIVEVYRATATIQVSQTMDANILESGDQNSDSDHYLRKLNTIEASLVNTDLMRQVITSNDLLNNSAFAGSGAESASLEHLARMLVSRTRANLREGTKLIDITVTNRDRDLATSLANWVSYGFVKQYSMRRLTMNRIANEALTNEAERLKIKLRNSEVALIDFRRSSKLYVSLEQRQSIVESRIASLSQSQDILERNYTRLKTDLSLVESFGDEPSGSQFEQVPSIWNSEEVRRYREMLLEEEMKLGEFSLRHKATHPVVAGGKKMLKRVEALLFESMKKRGNRLDADYQRLGIEREVAVRQLIQAEQESLTLSENAVEYNVLEREVKGNQALYSSVLDRIKEIDLTAGLMEEVITITQPATVANNISPPRNLWASAFTGLVLALLGVFLFGYFPFRLKGKS
jgi:polysaccharide biosynthesis transport protein